MKQKKKYNMLENLWKLENGTLFRTHFEFWGINMRAQMLLIDYLKMLIKFGGLLFQIWEHSASNTDTTFNLNR